MGPILGAMKHNETMQIDGNLKGFSFNGALFGLVI